MLHTSLLSVFACACVNVCAYVCHEKASIERYKSVHLCARDCKCMCVGALCWLFLLTFQTDTRTDLVACILRHIRE